jgi:hypothetical protein
MGDLSVSVHTKVDSRSHTKTSDTDSIDDVETEPATVFSPNRHAKRKTLSSSFVTSESTTFFSSLIAYI